MLDLNAFTQSYNKLLQYFAEGEHKAEMLLAKKEFFNNAGALDENKSNYPLRMNQFYDWYFLTRPLSTHMQTPLAVASQQRSLRLDEDDNKSLDALSGVVHSVFEFIKIKNGIIYVKDLFTNKKLEIAQNNLLFQFENDEFFEARYVEFSGRKHFLKGFCFHPESARKYILNEIKVYQKNPDLHLKDFLLRLNKMRYKFEQYRHIKPDMIYTNDNKLNL